MTVRDHWEQIYATLQTTEAGWYQVHPLLSLRLIRDTGISLGDPIIDIGAGSSNLVDSLLAAGFLDVTVLDISARALGVTRQRLRDRAARVKWVEADVTRAELPLDAYGLWHDRALFHFLIYPEDRRLYVERLRHSVRAGGHVIMAAFAPDGPERCSRLEVVRYTPEALQRELGPDFRLEDRVGETHRTPAGTEQRYLYYRWRKP